MKLSNFEKAKLDLSIANRLVESKVTIRNAADISKLIDVISDISIEETLRMIENDYSISKKQ